MHRLFEWLSASQHYFQDLGWIGILVYAGMIVVAQLFSVPLSPIAIAAGVFFGFGGGWLSVALGTAVGAAVNFLIARHLAREALTRRLGSNEKFQVIDAAIAQEGWKIVALLRFVPMPFGLANYCYGLTGIAFWPYLLTTVIAITPANLLLAWIGASAHAGLDSVLGKGRPRQPAEYILLGVGLAAGCVALVIIGRVARAALARSQHAVE